jgi:thiol:disulfide interchange protein
MPFGSIFGAIVFGAFGPFLGTRIAASQPAPVRVMGACVALLGLTVAAGLLMKRSWARWLGALAGLFLAVFAVGTADDVVHLTVMLASVAASLLLIVPATGRPRPTTTEPVSKPSWTSRVSLGAAVVSLVGFLSAAPFAIVRPAVAALSAAPETRQGEARPASGGSQPPAARPPSPSGSVTWHDFADGLKQAKSDRKLIVADFYATWCGPCKMMEKRTFHDPRVLARLHDVVPVRVDAEETTERGGLKGEELALHYAIEVYPTIVVIDGSGHEVARNTGAMGPDEFLEWIDSVLSRAGTSLAQS